MPVIQQLDVFQSANPTTQEQMLACYQTAQSVNNPIRENLTCAPTEYSMMVDFFNGAIRM